MKPFAVSALAAMVIFCFAACTPAITAGTRATTAVSTASPSPSAAATVSPSTSAEATAQPEASATDFSAIGYDLMDSESIGNVKLNMKESEVIAALGQPDAKSTPTFWGADGANHTDWTYQDKGLVINMTDSSNQESELIVFSIDVKDSCVLTTKNGIKIGDSKDAVLAAYGYAVEDKSDEATKEGILAGSAYGGMLFTMKDGKVTGIFIGQMAE